MSRFIQALCAFVLAAAPVAAFASHSTQFQRPDAFRHAVNPLIGDASFIARYGEPPAPGTDPELRVRTHLSFVHELLSQRDTSMLPAELRVAREQNLARFREYIDAGVFPHNQRYRDQTRPCFIDDDGRICAVGYLVEQSAGRDVAERINDKFQYAFVSEIQSPELDRWALSSGLSLEELSLIQPCYAPEFSVAVTQDANQTIRIRGYVFDSCDCGVKYVMFDFGEAMYRSPKLYYSTYLDISHTYSFPGAYFIKGIAVSRDECGNQLGDRTWMVNVGAAGMKLSAVKTGGGPPYGVYLTTTDEVQVNCLSASLVQWELNAEPQPTTWYFENGVYRTPVHPYPYSGTRTINVVNNYLAHCTTNQMGSVKVNVNNVPGSADETSVATTWGAIKAMYR